LDKKPTILWFVNRVFTEKDLKNQLYGNAKGWLVTLANQLKQDFKLVIVGVDPNALDFEGAELSTYHLRPKYWKWKFIRNKVIPVIDFDGDLRLQMQEIILREKPDIIHIHGTERPFISIQKNAAQLGIPVMVSIQGFMSAILNKYSGGYTVGFIKRFWFFKAFQKPGYRLLPQTLSANRKQIARQARLEQVVLPHINYFDGRTDWDRSICRLFNPNATYFQIDRILKPPFYNSKWILNDENNKLIVFTTTGAAIFKGFDLIAETIHLLQLRGIDLEWRIAGLNKHSGAVRAAQRKLGTRYPEAKIMLLGPLNAEQLVAEMLQSSLYATASFIENSPNNLAEAMLLGLPCIATLAGGTASYIKHETNGLLVQEGEPWAMAGAILRLWSDRSFAKMLGENAAITALARHQPEHVFSQVGAAYQQILSTSDKEINEN